MELSLVTENEFVEVTTTQKTPSVVCPNNNRVLKRNFDSIYYGIYIPLDGQQQQQQHKPVCNVFTDKAEALELVKRNKKARFKVFNYYHEAAEFATHGVDFSSNTSISKDDTHKQVLAVTEKLQFRGPKSQDLVKLRKAIEAGDAKFVQTTVWENPRYLISSGDTPSILQEGFRYNALHVAAKAKNAEMCELILNTVSNLDFIELLYGDGNQNSEERAKILLDLYLNMPDKGLNETPLHFAVKFGAVHVVEVLVSFPQCDKMIRNKYGKLPSQVICERCDSTEKMKNDIAMLLEDNYYVPVLRSEDNCNPPIIGEPFSPSSPPMYNTNPVNGRMEIHAYAGPMNKKGAEDFRKIWKTPPRVLNSDSYLKTIKSPPIACDDDIVSLKLKDHEKGLETVGRDLAAKYDIIWKEYWPFLASFIDLSSAEGLQQLETYLESKNSKQFQSSKLFNSGCEKRGPNFSDVIENVLCKAFQSLNLSNNGLTKSPALSNSFLDDDISPMKSDLCPVFCVEKACQVFAHRISADILNLRYNDIDVVKALQVQLKFLEQLMLSYLEDSRFRDIKLNSVHARLGSLILHKLLDNSDDADAVKEMMEKIQNDSVNNFSRISANKKLRCMLDFVLNELPTETDNSRSYIFEDDYREIWNNCAECTCIWQIKDKRKSYSNKRRIQKLKMQSGVSRCLFLDDTEDLETGKCVTDSNLSDSASSSQNGSDDSSSSDDEFYTPSSSLPASAYCSDEELYCDSVQHKYDIFIEGHQPTKTDQDVFVALKYVRNKLNPKEHPHLYKWHHAVSLYSEEERKSWPVPRNQRKCISSASKTAPSAFHSVSFGEDDFQQNVAVHSSPKSWIRVTGVNSPKASLRSCKNNISYNL